MYNLKFFKSSKKNFVGKFREANMPEMVVGNLESRWLV